MDDLYKEELLDIYKNPSHKGNISDPTVKVSKENSMCGDSLELSLSIKDGVITDAKFDGSACSVSIISAELLLEDIVGKRVEDAKTITKKDLLNLLNLNLTTSRVKCATLVLSALGDALKEYEEKKDVSKKSHKITKEDNLASAIEIYPEIEEILYDYGLHCVGCALNAFYSIETGSKIHGFDDEEIDEMVGRINEVLIHNE